MMSGEPGEAGGRSAGAGPAVVGHSVPRLDGVDKVTGRAVYTVDVRLPGMAHVRLVRSPLPRARIRGVERRAAAALPGVVAVLTAEDLRRLGRFELYFGHQVRDQPVLADGEVRYQGEPVAAVVAESEAAAEEAARMVELDLEPLEAADSLEAALREGGPLVHPQPRPVAPWVRPVPGTNVVHRVELVRGDPAAAMERADLVVEDTFEFPMQFHLFMEPLVAVAAPEAEGLTVWSSAQHPFPLRQALAEQFRLDVGRVRVIVPYVGGAYGGKGYPKVEPLACAVALAVGRPVRLALTLQECFQTIRSVGCRCTLRTAVRRDGRLVAREAILHFQVGAYADSGPAVARKGAYSVVGPYAVPHVRVVSDAVYTHTVPAGAFRGFGVPQVAYAGECQMERIARELGLDPVDLRVRNLVSRGGVLWEGDLPMDAEPRDGLKVVAAALGTAGAGGGDGRSHGEGARRVGVGFAVGFKAPASPSDSVAEVRLDGDGRATLAVGTTELGQGARTVLVQIAAEELGLSPERWQVLTTDTGCVPFDQSTNGSRSTTLTGLAVQRAARQLREELGRLASRLAGKAPERFADGAVWVDGRPYPYGELVRLALPPGGQLVARGEYRGDRTPTPQGARVPFWELGMGGARVEVDPETGQVRVLECVTAADVGKAIQPELCHGQDQGGATMGMGAALLEELVFQEGQLVNGSLTDYRVPTFEDLPGRLESVLVENGDGPGPHGAKGAGESGVYVTIPAVVNGVYQATGRLARRLPLTPERLWRLLQEQSPGAAGAAPKAAAASRGQGDATAPGRVRR